MAFPMDSSPGTDVIDDDSDTIPSVETFPPNLDVFASQTSLALLLKISNAIETARSEARIHWMNIESQINRQNMIENERNQILTEQNKLERERLEFERERFEFEKTRASLK